MRYYIEMLSRSLVDPTFITQCYSGGRSPSSSSSSSSGRGTPQKYSPQLFSNCLSASRQLENLICTNRESLIGSGAWNNLFIEELQCRPFYQATRCSEQMMTMMLCNSGDSSSMYDNGDTFDPTRCAACHRTSQNPDTQVSTVSTYNTVLRGTELICEFYS